MHHVNGNKPERIVYVEPLPDYRIKLRFSDGLEGVVDLSDMIGKGVFAQLADTESFAQVRIDPDTHTVAWPGGIDLCPDSLREEILQQNRAA